MHIIPSSYDDIINLIIYMLTAIHILGCFWIYIGNVVECSWLDQRPDNPGGLMCQAGITVDREISSTVYVLAVYFIVTTLVTVGYGDYKGYTPTEYLFQMMLEFLGIGVFSYLMGSINSLVSSETTLQDIIDDRVEKVENWLRQLEKTR